VNLSAEQFRQIIADARRQQTSDRRSEKRRSVRLGVRYTVSARTFIPALNAASDAFPASIRDISAAGIGLTLPRTAEGFLRLEFAEGGSNRDRPPHVVTCRITSCRPINKHSFQVGAVFEGQ
jgi:hypothetical protein